MSVKVQVECYLEQNDLKKFIAQKNPDLVIRNIKPNGINSYEVTVPNFDQARALINFNQFNSLVNVNELNNDFQFNYHHNMNDNTNEGIRHKSRFGIDFHGRKRLL